MGDVITSIIRTVVPMAVGSLLSFLASKGIDLDPETGAALVTFLSGLLSALYYIVARFLEEKFPAFGYLLGVPKPPVY